MVDFCAFFRRFFNSKEVISMETRVALIGIVVEDAVSIEKMNALLHQYGAYIIGRMGVPYQKRGINIISVAMDAPGDIISALSGKLGMLPGISTKTIYSKISSEKKLSHSKTYGAWNSRNPSACRRFPGRRSVASES